MAVKTNYTKKGKQYYRLTISLGRNSEGKLIRKEFYGSSKKDAESKRDEYLKGVNNGLDLKFDKKTIGNTMLLWLNQYIKVSRKPSTHERYEGLYRNYIADSNLHSIIISDIKPITIQAFYNEIYKKGKSSSTVNTINKFLKSFFNFCVNQGYVISNPCSGKKVTIPGNLKSEKKKIEVFSDDEIKKIIRSKERSLIKYLALFSISTGARRGECLGLKWSDISDDEIRIERSCKTIKAIKSDETKVTEDDTTKVTEEDENKATKDDKTKYKPILQEPKTLNSTRTIPLPNSLKSVLNEIKALQVENKFKARNSYTDLDFVFCNETGGLLDDRNISRSFKRFLRRCDVEYKNFHALRHTYATKQFELGVPLKTVSYLLGHSDIYITANTYTHVLKQHKEKTIDILGIM